MGLLQLYSLTMSVKNIQSSTLLLSFMWISISAQLLVPVTSPGATPKPTSSSNFNPSSCNYLVSRTNGVCMVTTSAVDQQLNAIKDDNFRARLQYMSQNSVLQTQIAKIESDDAKLSLRVDGLQRDLQSLRSRLGTPGVGTAPGTTTNINQIRTALQQGIQGVDNRVTGLAAAYQRDAVSQAQTNAAFQQQLTQLLQDNQQLTVNNNRLTQELQRLTNQVQSLAAQCSAGCGTPSNTPVAPTNPIGIITLPAATASPAPTINPARLAKIESDILALDNRLQQQNADLNILDQLVTVNHTQEIRNAALELRSHDLRILKNAADVNQVYQALQLFNTVTVPNLQANISILNQDSQALQALTAQLQAAQGTLINDTLFMKLDVAQLQQNQRASQNVQGQHRQAIDQLNLNLINPLLAAYPQLSAVQANVTSILGGNPAATGSASTSGPSTTPGIVIIPPTLRPPVTPPPSATTPGASTTGAGIIIPPTLRPVGPG